MLKYEFCYDKLQSHWVLENLPYLYIDTDSFIMTIKTTNLIEKSKHSKDGFDSSDVDPSNEPFDMTHQISYR